VTWPNMLPTPRKPTPFAVCRMCGSELVLMEERPGSSLRGGKRRHH
jgi:hypothetical protein